MDLVQNLLAPLTLLLRYMLRNGYLLHNHEGVGLGVEPLEHLPEGSLPNLLSDLYKLEELAVGC